jgi:hypothetical protein
MIRTKTGQELLLLHIPKNAGLSIRQVIGMPLGTQIESTHTTPDRWRQMLGQRRYENAYRFAVIRHPYTRAASAWAYVTGQQPGHRFYISDTKERNWVLQFGRTFADFIARAPDDLAHRREAYHFALQAIWLYPAHPVHCLLRFEYLAEDWRALAMKLGIPTELPHANAAPQPLPEITEATKARLAELYQPDFNYLRGYYRA